MIIISAWFRYNNSYLTLPIVKKNIRVAKLDSKERVTGATGNIKKVKIIKTTLTSTSK